MRRVVNRRVLRRQYNRARPRTAEVGTTWKGVPLNRAQRRSMAADGRRAVGWRAYL